jgi:xylulokinase
MMAENLFMAIDLGTSFIKAGVYDPEAVCAAQASSPVKDYRPSPGMFIQKGEELFESVLSCMKDVSKQLGERAKNIQAIVFSGQMSGFMGVSKDWEDITTWSCSLDNRYMPYAERQMKELKEEFLVIAGTNCPQMAPKFEWFKKDFPEENKKIAKYLMISGYVIGKLGKLPIEEAVIDRSYLGWTGLAEISNDKWSGKICDAIGLDQKFLPKIVNCNYVCGKLSEEMAKAVGLPSGIPLVAGAGDKTAGCLGSGSTEPGIIAFEASSYGAVSCCVKDYRPDTSERRLDVISSAIPGEFYMIHFAAGSGITLDWFVDKFVRRPDESKGDAHARMDKLAAQIPIGCNGLLASGLLCGSSMPLDGVSKGFWMGHDWSHGPEHFYRSLLESFSYDFALAIDSMDRLYPEFDISVRMIGGGARSSLWAQMSADVSNKPYNTIAFKDVSMWGAVLLAGNAVGLFPDLKAAAKKKAVIEKTFTPDPKAGEAYGKYKNLYKEFLITMRENFAKLSAAGA